MDVKLFFCFLYLSFFDFADIHIGQSGFILKFGFLVYNSLDKSRSNCSRAFVLVLSKGGGINKAQNHQKDPVIQGTGWPSFDGRENF